LRQKHDVHIFALARELGMESKDLVVLCNQHGIKVMSQLSTIEPAVRDQITDLVKRGAGRAAPPPPPPPPTPIAATTQSKRLRPLRPPRSAHGRRAEATALPVAPAVASPGTSGTPSGIPVTPCESPQVREAARLLRGKSIILIGGERRQNAINSLKTTLCLKEVYWIATREHQTHKVFESYVARPDVAVVLLAVRWSSHSFGQVSAFCDKYGKQFVRLPGGYHPNQVAHQILMRCGERLAEASAA
jgi:hypothetical protein